MIDDELNLKKHCMQKQFSFISYHPIINPFPDFSTSIDTIFSYINLPS